VAPRIKTWGDVLSDLVMAAPEMPRWADAMSSC
jgi:hypothetical protein